MITLYLEFFKSFIFASVLILIWVCLIRHTPENYIDYLSQQLPPKQQAPTITGTHLPDTLLLVGFLYHFIIFPPCMKISYKDIID
jgi:hypothetical protein